MQSVQKSQPPFEDESEHTAGSGPHRGGHEDAGDWRTSFFSFFNFPNKSLDVDEHNTTGGDPPCRISEAAQKMLVH